MITPQTALRALAAPALVILASSGAAAPARGAGETPDRPVVGHQERPEAGDSGTKSSEGPSTSIQLLLDRGVVYISLGGGLPGPVWFPRDGGELEGGVQVHAELDPDTGAAQVHFGRIGPHLGVEPACSYGLPTAYPWGWTGGFEPQEVACLAGWRLSAGTPPSTRAECGSCGAGVLCCPAPGECLQCGLCGRVCRADDEGERGERRR